MYFYSQNMQLQIKLVSLKKISMKKYAKLILASVFLFSMTAMAQELTPPPPGGQNEMGQGPRKQMSAQLRADNMAKAVSLTDAEKAKVQEVYEKNDVIFTKFRSEVKRDDPAFREKFKALRDAQDADLMNAIGKEKFDKWQKLQAERRQSMNNK
jgi:periplasmic protein CpxP/Spy